MKVKIISLALFSWMYFSLEYNFNVIVMQIRAYIGGEQFIE